MENVGFVVKQAPQAMAAKIAHDGAAFALGIFLDRGADIAGRRAWAHGGHAAHQRLIGHVDEALRPAGNLSDEIHAARIAVSLIYGQGHVDIEDIAFLYWFS